MQNVLALPCPSSIGHVAVDALHMVAQPGGYADGGSNRRLQAAHKVGHGEKSRSDLDVPPLRKWCIDYTTEDMPYSS